MIKVVNEDMGRWAQIDLHAEDEYKYCGNGGRSWVTADSGHVDTWNSKEAAIADGKKNYKKDYKFGRDWDVVQFQSTEKGGYYDHTKAGRLSESKYQSGDFKASEFMIKTASGNVVDKEALIEYLKSNGYRFVAGTYKDANHNRQGYQFVFYNGTSYIEYHRSGGDPNGSEILTISSTLPKTPSYKFSSFDEVHDLKKEASKYSSLLKDFKSSGLMESYINEAYDVSGTTPTRAGDYNIDEERGISSPAKAIELWFEIGAKHPLNTDISAYKKADAIALITWAHENQDKIAEWHKQYGCPYKLESMLAAIERQFNNGCKSFHESEYGEMIDPFCIG